MDEYVKLQRMPRKQFEKEIRAHAIKYLNIHLTRHQVRWIKFIHYSRDQALLLGPRRHGKSVSVNVVYLSWVLSKISDLRVAMFSHKKAQANEFSMFTRNVFEPDDADALRMASGLDKGKWTVDYWQLKDSNTKGIAYPTMQTAGAGSGIAGASYDWLIYEDLCDINNSSTQEQRDKLKQWVTKSFYTQDAGPRAKKIFIGTRQDLNDYYSELLINPDFDCWVDKALQDDGSTLWPERYPVEELEKIKRLDPREFYFQWQQTPTAAEGDAFKSEWLRYFSDADIKDNSDLRYYIGIDPSYGKVKKRTTFFSYTVAALDVNTDIVYIVEQYRKKLTVGQQKEMMRNLYWKYHNDYNLVQCMIETPLALSSLYEDVVRELPRIKTYSPIHDAITGDYKISDKDARIQAILLPVFEDKRIKLRSPEVDFMAKQFIEAEYLPFPNGQTDMLDSLVYAVADATARKPRDYIPLRIPRRL